MEINAVFCFVFKLVGERSQDMIIEGQLPLCVLIQFSAPQTVINVLHVFADTVSIRLFSKLVNGLNVIACS